MALEAPWVTGRHEPFNYRPEEEERFTVPAEVCDTCSDFTAGRLVPSSFCEVARTKSEELSAWLANQGPRTAWISQEHEIGTEPVWKMDAHQPFHRWICSCGKRGEGMSNTPEQARRSGREHAEAKKRNEEKNHG